MWFKSTEVFRHSITISATLFNRLHICALLLKMNWNWFALKPTNVIQMFCLSRFSWFCRLLMDCCWCVRRMMIRSKLFYGLIFTGCQEIIRTFFVAKNFFTSLLSIFIGRNAILISSENFKLSYALQWPQNFWVLKVKSLNTKKLAISWHPVNLPVFQNCSRTKFALLVVTSIQWTFAGFMSIER